MPVNKYKMSGVNENSSFEEINPNTGNPEEDLEFCLRDVQLGMKLFFNNQFNEASKILSKYSSVSLYHALGLCYIDFINALLTMEEDQINRASLSLNKCEILCYNMKRQESFGDKMTQFVYGTNYEKHTSQDIHAELCEAEVQLMKSLLSIFENSSLFSLVKTYLDFRKSYNIFKKCENAVNAHDWKSEIIRDDFKSGVKMLSGMFNLITSSLPPKVIGVLEFVGMSGDRKQGLEDLKESYEMYDTVRSLLSLLVSIAYQLYLSCVISHKPVDLDFCEEVIAKNLDFYPDSVLFLLYKGRLEFMKSNLTEAEVWYLKSLRSQNIWLPIQCVCYWDLIFLNISKQEPALALSFLDDMMKMSNWSVATFTYLKAVLLFTQFGTANTIETLMKEVPTHSRRIAGKPLPFESYLVGKTLFFFEQNNYLCSPDLELLYITGYITVICQNRTILQNMYNLVLDNTTKLKVNEFFIDNKCLLLLLKGVCLRYMNSPLAAENCFEQIINDEKFIVRTSYLTPYAHVELALLKMQLSEFVIANQHLRIAKEKFKNYDLEETLSLKIHSAQCELSEKLSISI